MVKHRNKSLLASAHMWGNAGLREGRPELLLIGCRKSHHFSSRRVACPNAREMADLEPISTSKLGEIDMHGAFGLKLPSMLLWKVDFHTIPRGPEGLPA